MDAAAYHHVGIRVTDLDRSTRFYMEVFDGELLWEEAIEPGFVPRMVAPDPDTSARCRYVEFVRGGGIELWVFEPARPLPPLDDLTALPITHLCLFVGDVEETVRRALATGGRCAHGIHAWDDYHFAFLEDPDGHAVEIVDVDVRTVARRMAEPGVVERPGYRRTLVTRARNDQ